MQETEIRASENGGVRAAAHEVVETGTTVAQLAAEDLKQQGRALGIGVGLGAGAALFAVYTIGFALATIAVALSTFLDWWLSVLIVTAIALVTTGLLAFFARRQIQKGSPAIPQHLQGPERERLTRAVAHLRHELGNTAKARARVPVATAAAGFILGGGLRAATRLAFRRRAR